MAPTKKPAETTEGGLVPSYIPKQPFRTGLVHKGQAIVGPHFKFPKQYKTMLALMPKNGTVRSFQDPDKKSVQMVSASRAETKQLLIATLAKAKLDLLTPPKGKKVEE